MIYAATTERSIAMVLLVIVVLGWAIYVFVNIRRSKSEIGSEIELAANRGSLPDDEALEGNRLERVQAFGVLMLLIIALALPIYWLREGGRRSGAEQGFGERAAAAGERLTEQLECVVCHGADLGGANYAPVVLDIGNQFSDQDSYIIKTTWRAPALDTIFTRFDTEAETLNEVDEVRQILNYGRGVMPAWGLPGGGPLTAQEVDNIIAWLWQQRISDEEASERALSAKQTAMAADPKKTEGQVLFELHCARCHTPRWPARGLAQLPNNGGHVQVVPGPAGSGRYGPALNVVSLERLFPDIEDQISFITLGAADNVAFGEFARLGNYGMPGFGRVLSEEEIRAISQYERSLDPAEQSTVQFTELHKTEDDK